MENQHVSFLSSYAFAALCVWAVAAWFQIGCNKNRSCMYQVPLCSRVAVAAYCLGKWPPNLWPDCGMLVSSNISSRGVNFTVSICFYITPNCKYNWHPTKLALMCPYPTAESGAFRMIQCPMELWQLDKCFAFEVFGVPFLWFERSKWCARRRYEVGAGQPFEFSALALSWVPLWSQESHPKFPVICYCPWLISSFPFLGWASTFIFTHCITFKLSSLINPVCRERREPNSLWCIQVSGSETHYTCLLVWEIHPENLMICSKSGHTEVNGSREQN